MIVQVGRRQHFGFVGIVDAQGLEYLRFDEMADSALCHDRDSHRVDDARDEIGVRHAGDTAVPAYVCRHAFQRHHGHCACVFRDLGVVGCHYVHNHPALEHLCEAALHRPVANRRLIAFAPHAGMDPPSLEIRRIAFAVCGRNSFLTWGGRHFLISCRLFALSHFFLKREPNPRHRTRVTTLRPR